MPFVTPPSSKYHTTLFKVPHHPLQSTTSPSSKYHITIFKVPHHPLQSTTSPSSKYHITLFNVPHHPLQSTITTCWKYAICNEFKCCVFEFQNPRSTPLLMAVPCSRACNILKIFCWILMKIFWPCLIYKNKMSCV